MADKDILALIRKRETERGQGMLDAYGSVMATQQNYSEQAERDAAIAALSWLVKDLQECAELYLRAQMRGGKGNAEDLKTAAGVIAPIVNQLRKLGDDSPGGTGIAPPRGGPSVPAEWCGDTEDHGPHTWRMTTVTSGDGLTVETVPGPMRECLGHHPRDTSGLDALIAERSGAAADGTVSSVVAAYLKGEANDIPGSPPLGPGSVPAAPPDDIERALAPGMFDDPAPPVTHTVLGKGQHRCSGLPAMPPDWSGPSTSAEGFRLPGAAAPTGDLFDNPAPRRGEIGRKISWSDLREIIGTDRRGAGLPRHLSHSQVDTLGECGLKYLMQRDEELGVVQIPQWALIGGNAFHAAVEWFERMVAEVRQLQHVRDRLTVFRDEHGGREQTVAEALWSWALGEQITETAMSSPVPQDDWRASKQGMEGYTWWLINGGDMVEVYLRSRLVELAGSGWRTIRQHETVEAGGIAYSPMIEHEFTISATGVPFTGFIDQVWTIDQQHGRMMPGDLLIDDCKSGARVGADTAQLGEYALALLQHEQELASPLALSLATGSVRIWGRFYDARKGSWTEPIDLLARHPADELAVRSIVADRKKAEGLFAPQRSNFCGGCSVKHACPIFATAP